MAIVAKFDVSGMDSSKYDEIIRRLNDTGQGAPEGRIYHICYGDRQRLQVIDVFEDPTKLEAFGARLAPFLQEMGVEAGLSVEEVYNIIEG
ncbi:MAG: hypothetical protein ACJ8J0_16680 [Longimicrobiaceae bacterium]